jgi:hypothetical protein
MGATFPNKIPNQIYQTCRLWAAKWLKVLVVCVISYATMLI